MRSATVEQLCLRAAVGHWLAGPSPMAHAARDVCRQLHGFLSHARVFLVGGAMRDLVLGVEPRDVDLLVCWVSPDELREVFRHRSRPTAMGGHKLKVSVYPAEVAVDVWALDSMGDERVRVNGHLIPEAYLELVTFDLDAVACAVRREGFGCDEVLEGGFLRALADEQLELRCPAPKFETLTCLRAVALMKRYALRPGPKLLLYLSQQSRRRPGPNAKRILSVQSTYYGREYVDADDLAEWGFE